ncbi:MAG: D-alanyl-D-alanine carboxypeptidase [Clostridia bacterium]|nr:D-alanyl-D-alanine carboxypeptidase [Clostridia bacterium]
MIKKLTAFLLLMINLFVAFSAQAAYDITPTAKSAIMIDAASGTVLYSKNPNERLGMASTTKIMTGILALEYGNLNDVYTVSPNGDWVEGSSIYLNPDEKITLETLLYGLLLKSGNDAALAIAKHISGSEQAFVALMNEKAAELGLKNTHFANPHGLYAEEHYTTAHELAKLAAYAMQNPVFEQIVNTSQYKEKPVGERDGRVINNANKLISMFAEADGIKPGYTPETGRTLVGSASKNGVRVITVTLDCSDDWNEHKMMFDHAFANFERKTVLKKGDSVGTYRVKNGNYNEVGVVIDKDIIMLVGKNGTGKYEIEMESEHLTAPVTEGQKVGSARICFEDGSVQEVSLLANGDVPVRERNFFKVIWQLFLALFGME